MKPSDTQKSPLERMNERLYKPQMDVVRSTEKEVRIPSSIRQGGWHHEDAPLKQPSKFAPSVVFLGAALLFFVVASGLAAFLLFTGGSSVSSDKVTIDINKDQKTAISSGDAVPLLIEIQNNNAVALINPSLTIRFPDGTYDPDQEGKLLTHQTIDNIDSIPSHGEPIRRTVRARLFGTENQTLSLPYTLEYKTEGSNAVFVKKGEYLVTVSNSPIALEVKTITEVSAGQDFTIVVTARSNATSPIPNVALKMSYPFGFSESSITPGEEKNGMLSLGTLAPGESKDITIHGAVSGNEGDERVLRFEVGTSDTSGKFVSYIEKTATTFITKPFLKVGLSLNRSNDEKIIVPAGSDVSGTISIGNTLSDIIQDGMVVLKIKGDIIELGSIQVTNGFYNSSDQTIRFSRETIPGLANLHPGESVNGTFTFRLKSASAIANQSSPSAIISVSATGNRSTAGNVSETLSSTLERTIQVQSALGFAASITHSSGPFKNGGAVPPTADQETQYGIVLQVSNGSNAIAKGVATMVLPSYVRFTGLMNPSDGSITYNDTTRTVTWNAGDIPANTKIQGAFQVAFLPSTSQRGTSPTIVSAINFSGHDRFVDKDLQVTAANLDTRTQGDAGYTISSSQVQ